MESLSLKSSGVHTNVGWYSYQIWPFFSSMTQVMCYQSKIMEKVNIYIYIPVLFTSLSSQQLSLLNAQGSLPENYKTQAKILTEKILLVNYDDIYQWNITLLFSLMKIFHKKKKLDKYFLIISTKKKWVSELQIELLIKCNHRQYLLVNPLVIFKL